MPKFSFELVAFVTFENHKTVEVEAVDFDTAKELLKSSMSKMEMYHMTVKRCIEPGEPMMVGDQELGEPFEWPNHYIRHVFLIKNIPLED